MKLRSVLIIILTVFIKWSAQIYAQNDSIKLHLKDYHSTQITDILVTKDEKRIITIDNSGKILRYDTKDFSFHSTLKKSDGFSIESPRLINNGNLLLYKSKDTLWSINGKGEVISKTPFKGSLLSNKENGPFIFTERLDYDTSSIAIYNEKFKFIKSLNTKSWIRSANLSADNKFIAFIEDKSVGNQKLSFKNLQNDTLIWNYEEEDSHKLVYPFFHKEKNTLFAITISTEKKVLCIYVIKNGVREKKPKFEVPWFSTRHSTFIKDNLSEKKVFIITDKSNIPKNPIVVKFENDEFTKQEIKIKEGAYSADLLGDIKLLTSNVFNTYTSIANFTVSNLIEGKEISSYPNFSQKFYDGIFLPDGSFLAYSTEVKKRNFLNDFEFQIKYFKKGTFYNRFNTLSFKDYLEVNHKISFYPYNYLFDKTSGFLIFRGGELKGNRSYIYKYNFINDKTTKLFEVKDEFSEIIDYDASSNKLLLSPKKYYNSMHSKPQPLAIVEGKKIIKFKGLYKFAKFSAKAKHILTLNDKNTIEIRANLDAIIYEEKLKKGDDFIIHKADDGFILSYNYYSSESYSIKNESIFFIPLNNNSFKTEKKPFIYISDLSFKNEKIALAIKSFGVGIGNKLVPESYLEPIKSVSFNKDASKLMISYAKGKISIIDTQTLKEIGGMFHPTEKEHIFYDLNNHYFSNTNADNFLFVTKGDKKVTLKSADKDIFKPEEVLTVFGKPNQEYLALLKKANSLRNNSSFAQKKSTKEPKKTTKKGNLYVLSIGVSKYKDEAFNLTFADKDAFDIASVYGKLDSITIQNFKDEFLGNIYRLQSSKNKEIGSLKRYINNYNSVGDMYALDAKGKIWLEINYNKAFVWNFDLKKIERINLPNGFNIDQGLSKHIYKSPKKNEFYIRTNDSKFYKLNLLTKTIEKINLPFEFKYNSYKNYKPIESDKWMCVTQLTNKNEFHVLLASENKNKIDTTVYKLNKYLFLKDTIQLESYNNLRPDFKSISSSGNYILFTDSNQNPYRVKLSKNEIPLKLPFFIGYSEDASISEDGSKITVLNKYSDDFRFKLKTYNLKGEVLDSLTFFDKDYNIKGLSIQNANPKWIETSSSLINDFNYSDFSSFKTLSNATPFSFNKTFVKKITNTEATKEKIEKEISSFLQNTKEEDQVIIFIAGHGVLDKKNNYYYAPHDMDFKDVTKNGVAFKTIVDGLSNTKATNKLLLMDTCHAGNTLDIEGSTENDSTNNEGGKRGTITKTNKRKPKFKMSEIVGSLFDDFLSKSGVTILSASSGSDVAYENKELSNGAFTSAYLKILKSKMGTYGVSEEGLKKTIPLTDDFISEVLKEVMLLTKGKQVPDIREVNKNVVIKVW